VNTGLDGGKKQAPIWYLVIQTLANDDRFGCHSSLIFDIDRLNQTIQFKVFDVLKAICLE